MTIYVSSSVTLKLDEYVEFLMRTCHYNIDEAETKKCGLNEVHPESLCLTFGVHFISDCILHHLGSNSI